MIIDMHIHTDKYSGCAHMSPQAMVKTAIERGMDGIVITEHDYLWSKLETQTLQAQFPELKILRGIEVSTVEGHALTYGVSVEDTAKFTPNISITELVRIVHDAGGIVILAHPGRYEDEIPDEVFNAGIDGVELMSMNVRKYMEQAIETIQSQLNLPGIAGTDAHVTESLGYYGTNFHSTIHNEQELVAAIKARAYTLYGDLNSITAYNGTVKNKVDSMQRLLQAGILSSTEIKAQYGFNDSFQKGVRRGKNMHLRTP